MPHFISLPEEVAAVFGSAAPKFVDFLSSSFSVQRDEVIQMSALSYEKSLEKEIAGVRLEIAELRAEMKADFADVQKQISGLHKDISGLHARIAGLHNDITTQTRWILAGLIGAATLYPLITRLISRIV